MIKMISPIFLFLILLPIHAQDNDDEKSSRINVRGFAFNLFENIATLELRAEEKSIGELPLPTGQLQRRIQITKRSFSYGVMKDDAFRSLGSVSLPEQGKDFILVFVPIAKGYKAFVVRADDPDFKGDDIYIFNFTKHKIGIMLGTKKEIIAPYANARVSPGFAKEDTYYQALFTYEKDGSYLPFNNTRWPVNPNTKALLFIYEDPTNGYLAYRSCTELAKP